MVETPQPKGVDRGFGIALSWGFLCLGRRSALGLQGLSVAIFGPVKLMS
jgi:hypothetical protein